MTYIYMSLGFKRLRILSVCVFWIFVFCLWSDQYDFVVLFLVFNVWIGPGFIFESFSLLLIFQ